MDRPSFWLEEGSIQFLDQRALPWSTFIITAETISEQAEAISSLAVRGAPTIGTFGALSLALSINRGEDERAAYQQLFGSRPTAVDLRNCMDKVMGTYRSNGAEASLETALDLMEDTIRSCRKIGESGRSLIMDNSRIMTHCNAGALATLDWGTALSPIRVRAREGGSPFVWVSETRPLLQGSRLTAWELLNEGIDHRIVVDGCAGHLMSRDEVDLVIVGSDRVAANGDIANKIGTLGKAVLAKEFGIPFYVAFPRTTVDPECPSGNDIPIEVRSDSEITSIHGSGIVPEGSGAYGPAFDVTPSKYITGYITEDGVLSKDEFVSSIIIM